MVRINAVAIIIITLFLSLASYARKTDGQFTIKVENQKASMPAVLITPKDGFHFNDKAPASIVFDANTEKHKPFILTEKKIEYKVLEKAKTARISFYICDDAKTVCEKQDLKIILDESKQELNLKVEDKKSINSKNMVANTKQKTTLLVFSAPWCPACIRIKSETLNKPSIKMITKNIEIKQINVDLIENEKISDQYDVKAIPTLVLINEQGEEIKRWLDFQTEATLQEDLKIALKQEESIPELKIRADGGDQEAASNLGHYYFSKMGWTEAAKYFEKSTNAKDYNYKLAAEVNEAAEAADSDDKTKTKHLQTLEKGYKFSTSTLDRARWMLEFAETNKEKKAKNSEELIEGIKAQLATLIEEKNLQEVFQKSTIGDYTKFEKAEILDMQRRYARLIENVQLEKSIHEKQRKELESIKLSTQQPGQILNAIWYYSQIDNLAKAESLYTELIKKYDKTYVYYQKYANFLVKQKRHEEALKQAEKALEYKEGNEPQLSLAKIKILKELGKKTEALDLIERALKITEQYTDKYKRTHAALLEIQKELKK